MNTSTTADLHWSRLLGLCPLVVIGLTPGETLLFAAALLLTLMLTASGMALLQRWMVATQRPIAKALLAAIIVAALDLLLQATYYPYAENLTIFSPLLIIVAVLLDKDIALEEMARSRKTLGNALSNALRTGVMLDLALVIFATLRLWVPTEASTALSLIGSGLLLAFINKFASPSLYNKPTPRAPRARVTGPVR